MRRRLKRQLNRRDRSKHTKQLGWLGRFVSSEALWHVNRRSVARAAAIGLFSAYLPMPMEMVVAALLAIIFRANIPISVLLVWVSNPLTWLLLYGPPYLFGSWLLGYENIQLGQLTVNILSQHIAALWLGCVIVGTAMATGAYFTVHLLWRMDVVSDWEARRRRIRLKRERLEKIATEEGRSIFPLDCECPDQERESE